MMMMTDDDDDKNFNYHKIFKDIICLHKFYWCAHTKVDLCQENMLTSKLNMSKLCFVPKDIKLLTEEMESGIQTYIITKLTRYN